MPFYTTGELLNPCASRSLKNVSWVLLEEWPLTGLKIKLCILLFRVKAGGKCHGTLSKWVSGVTRFLSAAQLGASGLWSHK